LEPAKTLKIRIQYPHEQTLRVAQIPLRLSFYRYLQVSQGRQALTLVYWRRRVVYRRVPIKQSAVFRWQIVCIGDDLSMPSRMRLISASK